MGSDVLFHQHPHHISFCRRGLHGHALNMGENTALPFLRVDEIIIVKNTTKKCIVNLL